MVEAHVELDPHAADENPCITFILPKWDATLSFSCAKDWVEDKRGYQCGCPNCLRKFSLCLIYHVQDVNQGVVPEQCRLRIVSRRTAIMAPNLQVPGYI